MQGQQKTGLFQPESVSDAVAVLSDFGPHGSVVAGGTWIMRAPLRHECFAQNYVAIARIPELHRIDVTDTHVKIGAGVTHGQLARGLLGVPELYGLTVAARDSANPAVRNAATVGGNLCTVDFPAADLVTALLCHDAEVELETVRGRQRMGLEAFLRVRGSVQPAQLLLGVLIPRRHVVSAHARLPMRKAGDYPVALVSAAVERAPGGTIGRAAIAIGSVEAAPRRWRRLEEAVAGLPLDPTLLYERACELAGEFAGRDGPEAPGWYRVHVMPALVRRTVEDLRKH
ncbi:FAD binding domain-containing protein [Sinorhizobium arboris]|uniref:FAD binding domain-containing protein n=1 Tax=Sinorhizobium arboris TaxID=76745 RepID=UPI0004167651|nr:FAD binding domain-containing protein [Sinorhizobium arboris]